LTLLPERINLPPTGCTGEKLKTQQNRIKPTNQLPKPT
jgi:hypothetical protein